jgi:hypothetical protein
MKTSLARALNLPPEMIREWRQHGRSYTVILADFRKIENVRPDETALVVGHGKTAVSVPQHLHAAYANPLRAPMREVRELGYLLGLEGVWKLNKRPLVALIKERQREIHETETGLFSTHNPADQTPKSPVSAAE